MNMLILRVSDRLVRPASPVGVEVEERGRVHALPAGAHAVAVHHLVGQPFQRDRRPDRGTLKMGGDRDLVDGRDEPPERLRPGPDPGVHVRLRDGMAEALLHHRDAKAPCAPPHRRDVVVHPRVVLARVESVLPRDRLQHDGVVEHAPRHRPGVVDGRLDGHDAGVGDEPVGRLHPVAPAVRRRDPDRAALVAADGHVHEAAADQRAGARRRAARRVAPPVRVLHRPRRVGVAPAGETEVLAVGLADDGGAGIEQPGDDGRVHVRGVALQRRSPPA